MALNRAITVVGFSFAAFALMGMGQQEPSGEKISLRLNPKIDERFEYVTAMELDFGKSGTLKGKLSTADRILEIGEESYTARHYIADMKYVGTGVQEATASVMESAKGAQAIHEVNFRGFLIAVDEVSDPAPVNFDVILPSGPVAVGETWTEKLRLDANGVEIPVKFKLESFTDSEATISALGTDIAGYKFGKPHLYVVHRKTGKTISGEGQMTASFGGVMVDMKMKINLVSPDFRKKN